MEQTCELLETSLNQFGGQAVESAKSIKCRFRFITELDRTQNREGIRSDALLWISPKENIIQGTLVRYNNEVFRVDQIIEARRLRGETIYFKKCLLNKYAEVASEA